MAAVDLSAVIPGAVGLELDIATGKEVEELGHKLDGHFPDLHPQIINLDKSGKASTASLLVMDLGAPAMGKVWSIRKFLITGADDHTAVATASVALYVTNAGPGAYALTDLEQTIAAGNIPSTTTYSSGQLTVPSARHLIVVLAGAGVTTTQLFTVQATALEVDDDPRWLSIF